MNITSLDGGIVQPEENASSSFESWTQVNPQPLQYTAMSNAAKNPRQLDIATLYVVNLRLAKYCRRQIALFSAFTYSHSRELATVQLQTLSSFCNQSSIDVAMMESTCS